MRSFPASMLVDLHIHTTASDGTRSPAEVVRIAAENNVSVIGISDHDTVAGIDEAKIAAGVSGVLVVPSVEINAYHEDAEYHILGHFINYRNEELKATLADRKDARIARMHIIISKLALLGINVTAEEILELAGDGTVGRPHIAQALVNKRYASSIRDAFDKYIADGKPAYAPRSKMTPREAIEIIRRAGGLPTLAHPGLFGGDEIIPELAAWGIVGLEVFSPNHSPEQVRRYTAIAGELGLVMTGGSDFHGWGSSGRESIGACSTPVEQFARLKQLAGAAD